MSVTAKLALYGAALAVVFGGAALAGGAVDPDGGSTEHVEVAAHSAPAHGGKETAAKPATSLPGLAVAQDGLRLVVASEQGKARRDITLRFRIDRGGRPLTRYEVRHDKRMHLIVVRRDLTGFQHLHPEPAADGTWSARADFAAGGAYRVFADFTTGGVQRTLGADVHVNGRYDSRPLAAASTTATDDRGLNVELRRDGERLEFVVRRDGRVVNDRLEPYLGAKGHLVTLRAGDLAYLHTHPEDDALAFGVDLPSAGSYRHFVQYRLDGRVHTAAFTQEVKAG